MVQSTPSPVDVIDPRVRRTREMLHGALGELLELKAFESISVGDIAKHATVNRATFYDHYPDKFALLEGMVSQQFQELLDAREVVFDGTCANALLAIILAMCDYLAGLPGRSCPNRAQADKYFEAALMGVVRGMILQGFAHHAPPGSLPKEVVAATISGAIYGGVNEWVRTPGHCPAEELVPSIFALVQPMMG